MSSLKPKSSFFQQSLDPCPRINHDKRTETAYRIYERFRDGHYLVHKTTRAGATTSLITESMNRNEKVLCLVPTNRIADETIVKDAKIFCDRKQTDIIHLPANHRCIYNQELCKEFPDLKKLPILPLGDSCESKSGKCKHYEYCEITAIFRRPEADGIVLTYHKLAALLLASTRPNTTAERILKEINNAENIILDEVHEMQYGKREDLTIYDDLNGSRWKLDRFESASEKFEYIGQVINRMNSLKSDEQIQNMIHEVLGGAENRDYWKHHLTKRTINPCYKIGNTVSESKIAVGTIKEIIELTKCRKEYNLNIEDILELYKMMAIVTSEIISINAIKDSGIIKINLTCIDYTLQNMINSFVMSMQKETRRIFLTSATICSYDYSKLFLGNIKPVNITFGVGGDPLNTNAKMVILADNKKYNAIGDRSRYNKRGEIVSRIIEIMHCYGAENCKIVTVNMKEARTLEHALDEAGNHHTITYYKSPEMMGVSSDSRIMIAVGIAHKPSNAFDAISKDAFRSKILLHESVHCDTWQAWSRVKDPNGKEESIVFALGCCIEDCRNIVEWGFNRTLDISENNNGEKKKITVSCGNGTIRSPKIIKCKTFDGMLEEAFLVKLPKQKRFFSAKPSISLLIDGFSVKNRTCLDSSRAFLNMLINRTDVYGQQQKDGTYRLLEIPITENTIREHLKGNITIGTYHLNKENKVRSICFDIDSHAPKKEIVESEDDIKKRDNEAEERKVTLSNFLTLHGIPFVLEASGSLHSYHFWILLEPVDAEIAHNFGNAIREALVWKAGELEIFPKQKKIDKKGYGNLIKLPFATHQKHGGLSKIQVNGEFVRVFDSLEIGILDISSFVPLVTEKAVTKRKKTHVNHIRVNGKIRYEPRKCILEAINKQLPHFGGNQLRVAIVRELHLSGMEVKDIVDAFSRQTDFNRVKTLYHVNQILKKDIPVPASCRTIYEQCGDLTGCKSCENFGVC